MAQQSGKARRVGARVLKRLNEEKQLWRDQVIFDRDLSGLTKAVAYAMANWMTAPDVCDAYTRDGKIVVRGRQRAIAEMVGCSAKTVHLAMAALIERGYVLLIRRPQGRDDTNLYHIIPASASRDGNSEGRAPVTRPPASPRASSQSWSASGSARL